MRARRVDGNHGQIMAAFRRMGCAVADTSRLGGGFPDLAVSMGTGRLGVWALVEVKDGTLCASRQALTTDEAKFHAKHPVEIVRDLNDCQRVANMLRKWQSMKFNDTLAD